MEQFTKGQLLRNQPTDSVFDIVAVSEKAIGIEYDNSGRWNGGTPKTLWIPKSILDYVHFNDSRENSDKGIHVVKLPDWFINKNRHIGW